MLEYWNDGQSALIWHEFVHFLPNIPAFQSPNIPCTIIAGLTIRNPIFSKFAISRIKRSILIFFQLFDKGLDICLGLLIGDQAKIIQIGIDN